MINENLFVAHDANIRTALEKLNGNSSQIVCVIDENQRLIGLITDGDLRRGLLKGMILEDSIISLMNANPLTMPKNATRSEILAIMRDKKIHQMPIIDEDRRVISLHLMDEIIGASIKPNHVVLMVGGLGTRLRPLTETTPKPLIPIGGKPILLRIIENLKSHGFTKFSLCVNYKQELFHDYFGDGKKFACQIDYIHETTRMGTAGALSLWQNPPQEDFLVMNGDILTNFDFSLLLNHHIAHRAIATVAVRDYTYQVPFGVITEQDGEMLSIVEKPSQSYFINAGIYACSPKILDFLAKGTPDDMPNLLQRVQKNIRIFPIKDYWLDIGRFEDLKRAEQEYKMIF